MSAKIGIRHPRSLLSLQRVISSLGLQFTRDGGRSRTFLERPLAPLGSLHQLDIHEAKNSRAPSVILEACFWKIEKGVNGNLVSSAHGNNHCWNFFSFFFSTLSVCSVGACIEFHCDLRLKVSALGEIKSPVENGEMCSVLLAPFWRILF